MTKPAALMLQAIKQLRSEYAADSFNESDHPRKGGKFTSSGGGGGGSSSATSPAKGREHLEKQYTSLEAETAKLTKENDALEEKASNTPNHTQFSAQIKKNEQRLNALAEQRTALRKQLGKIKDE